LLLRRKLLGVTCDHFAELGIARRAWLDAEEIKFRHHTLMADSHPDKSSGDTPRATRLNAARGVLENSALRLRHLVELEFPGFSPIEKPQPNWDLFSRAGEASRLASELAAKNATATNALTKALLQGHIAKAKLALLDLRKEFDLFTQDLAKRTRSLPTPLSEPQIAANLAEEWTFLQRMQATVHNASADIASL
jgi:hypothetical protein